MLLLLSCDRDPRSRQLAVSGERAVAAASGLQAGGVTRLTTVNPFERDQQALADGERLFGWMNCAGCHGAKGGGAIGPPFRDRDWIYGDDPASLFQSVAQGRPNGMPAFGGKLPDEQIWKIVLYVESLAKEGEKSQSGTTGGPGESTRRRQPGGAGGSR